MQALSPVSSVAAPSPGKRGTAMAGANSGKDLPPPPRSARLDPQVIQVLNEKRAAVAQQVSDYLRASARDLEFFVDAESGDPVIIVRDASGNEVRRIPGDDALRMLRQIIVDPGTFVDAMV